MNDLIGKIVVIKRNGADGPQFPLRTNECLFGRKPECDIRIQLPNVSLEHAVVKVDNDKKIKLINLSSCNQTLVNGKPISEVEVQHLDIFTISDRSFRFELPSPVEKQAKEKLFKTPHRRSSSTGNTPQKNRTPKMLAPKGSPRTPLTGGSLKENIYRLRRHSMPLQEEEEALTSPESDKTPFSIIAVNCEPQEKNGESAEPVWEKRKSEGGECKTKRSSKRVSFGPVLSPEQFDKELPPATPVRRGATPRRASNASDHSLVQLCSSSKKRRSVIASPQTESITEEDNIPDSSENETPNKQVHHSSKLDSSEQRRGIYEVNIHELISQQFGTPKERAQPFSQFDKCTETEDVIPQSPTPEKCTNSSKRAEKEITESVATEVRKQFPSNQFTPKNAKPNHRRRSSSRLAEKNCVSGKKDRVSQDYATPREGGQSPSSLEDENVGHTGPNQAASKTDTPQMSRRSSMRLAGNSPSLFELQSFDVIQSKVPHSETASLNHSVEENMDETILDSDDYTSDEEDADREMAIGKDKPTKLAMPLRKEIEGVKLHEIKKNIVTPFEIEIVNGIRQTKRTMATPLRTQIEEGIKLQETKKRMATPLKKEISEGIRLRETKNKLATPLQKEIDGTNLRQTKRKKMATPLRKDIEEGIKLRETKKMVTPLKKEISAGIRLRETKKRLATPLKREIIDGTSLRRTKRRMATPLKKEITEGITLRGIKKKLKTPIRKAIEDGVTLRVTKKKLSTPIQKAIQAQPKLRKTKRTMNSLLQKEIKRCPKLRKTKQTMPLEVQIEIIKGKQLRPIKRSLPTPLKEEISSAVTLRQTKRRLPTLLQEEIKRGVELQKAKKSLPTPVRRQLEEGVLLKQTGRSLKRKRSESSTNDNEPKRLKSPPSIAVNETDEELGVAPVRRALKTPLRKAIAAGSRLRTTRHRMATPLRKQIHSKHILRAVRRKSTAITVPEKTFTRKPTYAEIVKRPKKMVPESKRVYRESSCKFRNVTKGSSKVIPSVKISEAAVKNPEIARGQVNGVQLKNRRNSTNLARKSTPQTKSAKLTDSQGMPTLPATGEKAKRNWWMSSLARATNGVKTRGQSVENLEGLSEIFTTPPAVQMTSNNFRGENHSGNWFKATIGPRKRGMPVEDLRGVPEMFATPPSPDAGSDCNRGTSMKSLSSTDEEATVEIRNVALLDTLQVKAEVVSPYKSEIHMIKSLEPTKTPSLRSSGKDTTHIEIVSPIKSSCTSSLRSGRNQTSKSAVTPRAMFETGEILKPYKTPSLCNSAEDTVTVQVVIPVQPSRTPSLRSARTPLCIQNSDCSDLELEIVQPITPNKTPSMRSSAETKAVLRKSVGNPTKDRKCPGLQLIKSPKESNSAERVEDFLVPNMFASPKPRPKRYSRKSEGLQGVPRLLRTPDAEDESAEDSPKLDGIKSMMQPEKSLASPYLVGLKTLVKTPKISQRYVDPEEYFSAELFASPVQDSSQDTAQSAARGRSVIRPTSSKTEATTAERSENIVSDILPRATRSKRKAPEDSVEPVPKRVRRTRATVKQQMEGKTETRSSSKVVQNSTAAKSQKKTPEVIQDTPKPFLFRRTKLDPIIEVQSPLPSFDDAIEITTSSLIEEAEKASNGKRKTGNASKTRKQFNAPLRSSRRGNRCKTPAGTAVEEFTTKKVAERYLETRGKKNESVVEDSSNTGDSQKAPVKTPEPKGERKRATRNTKANGNSLNTIAPPIKTRMTRNQRAEIAVLEEEVGNCSFIKEAVKNPAPRRARSVAKTTEERAQVLGKTKPTRRTGLEETLDEVADLVPEYRSTRATWKQANKSNVVENDNLVRSTRGKNSRKEEVKEVKKEVTTKKMKQPPRARSIRRTRGNSAHKAEGDDSSLEVEKEVRPDNSSKKPRARRELKRNTKNESKETMSTRSKNAVEDQVEFTVQSLHSKVGTKRSHQENARKPPPDPKRTRASVQAQSGLNMRITRSHSQK